MTLEKPDMSKIDNPLSPEDIASLREWQKAMPKIEASIAKAKAAGIDVSEDEQKIKGLKGQLDSIVKVYG